MQECPETKQFLTAVSVFSALKLVESTCRAISVASLSNSVSAFIQAFGLASAIATIALEKPLYFDVFSKLFLISHTLREDVVLWRLSRSLEPWPLPAPLMASILIVLQLVCCFITFTKKLRDFAVDLPAVLFLLFDTLQRLVLYFLYTRALKSRRDLRTKTDVWYVCVSRILRTIIVAVSETVAIILLLCGLGRRLPMHVVVLVVAVMAAPLPKDALPCVRTLTSWVSSLNQSSDSTSAITTIHSETSTVTIIEDHQTLESLVEQLEAAAKKFKQAQKASGMRVEVFGTPAEPAMPGHGLSIKRSVTRELEVVEVAVDYTNALLELAQLLKMSTPGDMESVVHSKLAYFIAILKSEMLLHVHNFMLSDQSIHEPNLLVTMATCIGCLDVYAELADPSLRDCFGAIILVLEQARLALDQYRSDIAGMMRNLYMFHPSSQAVIGISSRPATALT